MKTRIPGTLLPRITVALRPILAVVAICGIPLSGQAGLLTIQHSNIGKFATNFSDHLNLTGGTDGLYWGILVDTNGDGFQAGSYLSFGSILIPQFLSTPSGITDDYWVGSTNPTFTAAALPDGGLPGTINLITNVPVYDAENPSFPIQVNDLYGLMWFSAPPLGINASTDTVADIGDKYGFYQNAGLQITSASGSIDNSGIFAGADPVRNTGAENGPPTNPTGTGYTIIPEPSVVSLLLSLLPLAIVGRLRRHGPVGSRNP